ncbi:peptidoglycan bridge formation glycyltransferase FemA/FemB family protein [Patescibacteria group bacterium]|nr:peptidoglycan bridge formation glycyltransferase FemA/FemB family protein [Patescibacteria group bacterium]
MKLLINSELERSSWDRFTLRHPEGNLLQSWAWGEFQEALGNPIWRLQVTSNNEVLAQLLALKLSLGFGKSIIYTPREVLINSSAPIQHQRDAMELIVKKMKEIGKAEKAILWRTDPPLKNGDTTALSIYKAFGFIRSKKSIQPQTNWVLDITAGANNLLTAMKPKTRYNIRLAEKKGVKVVISKNLEDIRIFNQLNKDTATRDGFTPHSDGYYKKQLEALSKDGGLELLVAYLGQTPVSAILVSFFGNKATYLHGASSNEHRETMANYAIQWAAIQAAQSKGCATYDFGGIDLGGEHPNWAGITRFKQGFGGSAVEYVGTLELPLSPLWYRFYKILRGH